MSKHEEGIRTYDSISTRTKKGLGPDSAGQSGDTQGLSDKVEADSESVQELLEEGQAFEAEAVDGVENAPDADVAEVHTPNSFRRMTSRSNTRARTIKADRVGGQLA